MKRTALFLTCLIVLPLAAADDSAGLPVKRVVLYKNGVGYFEHLGTVRGNQDVAISFTSGQLNDVLKTLTVLDLSGGRITGVTYGSAAPVDRQLGDLHLNLGEKPTLTEFLGSLRGSRVEIRNGQSVVTGRLLSIERKTRTGGGTTLEVDYVALLTDAGEVRTTEITPAFSVKLLDRGLPTRIERYLDLVSSNREPDLRRMVISTAGAGDRPLFVSYISEVPVWKTTYRIVLKSGESPLLQGWAIVDNTVGQDWTNVWLSLVAGAPQSFVQQLSQPYYARRPVVPLPESANISPQTYEATMVPGGARIRGVVTDPSGAVIAGASVKAYDESGSLVGETNTTSEGRYDLAVPDGVVRLQVSSNGFRTFTVNDLVASSAKMAEINVPLQVGSAAESVSVNAAAQGISTSTSEIAVNGRIGRGRALGGGVGTGRGGGVGVRQFSPPARPPAPPLPAAQAQELGDLFEYKLKEPITIHKNQSALVPIVQSKITAEKVSVWNDRAGLPRPQRALWVTNSSGLTLDGGSFSVLEEETFAGEGIMEPVRPGEKRIVSYATDLAVNASSKQSVEPQRVTHVMIAKGILTQDSEVREAKTYTFRNEDTSPRVVLVEHPARQGYELRSAAKPVETTAGLMRFRVPVAPKETAALVVEESRPIARTFAISNITSDQVALFVRDKSIDGSIEQALRRVLAQKDAVDEIERQKDARDEEMKGIYDDQQRLRENMKALKGSAEEKALLQRYTQQLNQQEDRLAALKKEIDQLAAKQETAQAALSKMIEDLSFDVRL